MKEMFSKLFDFAVFCIYALGAIGSSAYLFYDGHTIFGVASLAMTAMAIPYLKKRIEDILL